MTRDKQQQISKKISDFLLTLRREDGVITNMRTNYKNDSVQFDILIEEEYTDEKKQTQLDIQYTEFSKKYGFTQNIVGMIFEHPKLGEVKVSHFKTNNRKYPIIGYTVNGGKGYKFTPIQVKSYLGGDKLINRNSNLDLLLGKS